MSLMHLLEILNKCLFYNNMKISKRKKTKSLQLENLSKEYIAPESIICNICKERKEANVVNFGKIGKVYRTTCKICISKRQRERNNERRDYEELYGI